MKFGGRFVYMIRIFVLISFFMLSIGVYRGPVYKFVVLDTGSSKTYRAFTVETTQSYLRMLARRANLVYSSPTLFYAASSAAANYSYEDKVWGQNYVNAFSAYDSVKNKLTYNPVVAVLDTGIDTAHFKLSSNLWINDGEIRENGKDDDGNGYVDDYYGYNFVDKNSSCGDDYNVNGVYGHGTRVAGIIAAKDFGDSEMAGICQTAKIMSVKVLDNEGVGELDDVVNGLYYAVNNGADVINLSFVQEKPSDVLGAAIEYAYKKGAVIVVAVGDEGLSVPVYPAYAEYTIAVAAMNKLGYIAQFSNRGDYISILAPGVDIYSTIPQYMDITGFDAGDGTSYAAAFVSGAAALLKSYKSSLKNYEITGLLLRNTQKSAELVYGQKSEYGYGILDVAAAVSDASKYSYNSYTANVKVYPNPFYISRYSFMKIEGLPNDPALKILIYDINGRLIRTLDDPYFELDERAQSALWDGKNDYNESVGSGIYYLVIKNSQGKIIKKVTVIK